MSSFTEAQRDERRSRIGASEVAALCGLSKWATPMSVWLDKMGLADEQQAEHLDWGHKLEDVILDEFEQRTGLVVANRQELVRHPNNSHHGATPDGQVYEGRPMTLPIGVVDCKLDASFGWSALPDAYLVQSQWQQHCREVDMGWVVVLHAGRKMEIYEVRRDQRLIDHLVGIVDRFWFDHVVTGEMPPVDGRPETERALRELYPWQVTDASVEIPVELAEEYRMAKEIAAQADADLRYAKQKIQALMGDAEYGTVNGTKAFSWRGSETTTVDTKALKARHPRAVQKYARTTTSRRFLDHLKER